MLLLFLLLLLLQVLILLMLQLQLQLQLKSRAFAPCFALYVASALDLSPYPALFCVPGSI